MTRDEIDALIRRLEAVSRQRPRWYLFRTAGIVLLAYGYLGLVLGGSLALSLLIVGLMIYAPNAVTLKFGLLGLILFGGLAWAVARGLWVRLEPPDGLPVQRLDAPKLFSLLDELRAALNCRPFDQVLLVGDYNAAVVQIPRLGVFGWHRNFLLLGLPLMQSLTPQEFKAVLAHEFAHSSRGHGRFGNWLYRMRRVWERIFEQMARQRSGGAGVLRIFLRWFWPVFNAHAFVLARANEYEADACSVRLAGADATAGALMRLPVDGAFLEEKFWPDLFARAKRQKEPPTDTLTLLGQALKSGPSVEDTPRWIRQAFLTQTSNADTHPCLRDRLHAIGRLPAGVEQGDYPNAPPPASGTRAAEFFLEAKATHYGGELSRAWAAAAAGPWAERFNHVQQLVNELATLEHPSAPPPNADTLWARSLALLQLHGDAATLPVLEQLLALNPQHAGAHLVRGRCYLDRDDPRGVTSLEQAMTLDPTLTPDCCEQLYAYYNRNGQQAQLRPLLERMDRFHEEETEARRERAQISANDRFTWHQLTPPQLEALRCVLATEPQVVSAAVVRKEVSVFPQSPCFVIGVRLKVAWWKPRSSKASQNLIDRLVGRIQLQGHFFVFVDESNLKKLAKRIYAIEGAEVYTRT